MQTCMIYIKPNIHFNVCEKINDKKNKLFTLKPSLHSKIHAIDYKLKKKWNAKTRLKIHELFTFKPNIQSNKKNVKASQSTWDAVNKM